MPLFRAAAESVISLAILDLHSEALCHGPSGPRAVLTLPLHKTLTASGVKPDLVVVAVPAPHVPAVIKECSVLGVRAALITAGGFAETTGDQTVEEQIWRV